jgi:hypothetical protein
LYLTLLKLSLLSYPFVRPLKCMLSHAVCKHLFAMLSFFVLYLLTSIVPKSVNQVTDLWSRVFLEQLMTYLSSQEIVDFVNTQTVQCSTCATQILDPNRSEDSTLYILTYCLILYSLVLLAYQSDFFPSGFGIKMLHASLMYTTCPLYLHSIYGGTPPSRPWPPS